MNVADSWTQAVGRGEQVTTPVEALRLEHQPGTWGWRYMTGRALPGRQTP